MIVRLVVEFIGPSPQPKNSRHSSSDVKPVTAAVNPHMKDHLPIDQENTRKGPNRSAN